MESTDILMPCQATPRQDILDQLNDVRDLPTLPSVFMRLMEIMRNPQASIHEISRVVETDQAIAMRILRLINSSFYGLPRSIYSVQQAIVLLGSNTLRNIIITASVFEALGLKSKAAGLNREAFWQHVIGCAMIARCLDKKINGGQEEEGFIAGIIHDIGKVILDQYFHDKLIAILRQARKEGCTFHQAENDLFGVGHAEIGARLADLWCLPPNLIEVILYHHDLREDALHARLTALIHVADVFTRKYQVGFGGDDRVPEINPLAWRLLDVDPTYINAWEKEIQLEIEKGRELLSVMQS